MKHKQQKPVKMPKVKIPPQDLQSFLIESLEIDPFWHDLYGIDNQRVNNKNSKTTKF